MVVLFMENEKRKLTQKGWFRNTILIAIPAIISLVGIVISLVTPSDTIKYILIAIMALLTAIVIIFATIFSKQDEKLFKELERVKGENDSLTAILANMENHIKTQKFTITTFTELLEKWAKNINSFSNTVSAKKQVSNKNWDKIKYFDAICVQCRNMLEQHCNNYDNSKISVGFVSYKEDADGGKYVHMVAHSNPESTRPNACKKEEKLSDCTYHYATLIKDQYSGIEVAVNNEEILRIFNNISKNTDLTRYSQYIAIPVYCTSNKLLGIFQVVTKYDYIIESDRVALLKFAEEYIIPYSNLIVLADKINKGLYINPGVILEEE